LVLYKELMLEVLRRGRGMRRRELHLRLEEKLPSLEKLRNHPLLSLQNQKLVPQEQRMEPHLHLLLPKNQS
tara:strand:- start:39 stop:251 length:213 start_codon:yes stop_codon:yes gene_type:complete